VTYISNDWKKKIYFTFFINDLFPKIEILINFFLRIVESSSSWDFLCKYFDNLKNSPQQIVLFSLEMETTFVCKFFKINLYGNKIFRT
jgi:hypothetical protein